MSERILICYRCLTGNRMSDLRPAGKIKGLTAEESRKFKTCRACSCRTFFH